MSGGQAKNAALMQLFANTCDIPVVVPHDSGTAVVLGAAMLGRFAGEAPRNMTPQNQAEALWKVMVSMTPPGTLIPNAASEPEKKLLEAKYKIFRESIDIQKRWRQEMYDATH